MLSVSLLTAALALGVLATPHCASMCACQFATPWLRQPLPFQLGRMLAYTGGGALAGGLSSSVLDLVSTGVRIFQALNWMLMAVLFFSAVLLLCRGQTLGSVVQQRIHLPAALARRLGSVQKPAPLSSLKAGLLWLFMPCGVLWAALVLAYLAGSAVQGAAIMAVFALASGTGLQLASKLRQSVAGRMGEALMLRANGGVILLGLCLMAGRQSGWIATPVWLQGLGFCL